MPHPPTLFRIVDAEAHPLVMQDADDMGWTYRVEVVNMELGFTQIAVFDDEGFLAGIF